MRRLLGIAWYVEIVAAIAFIVSFLMGAGDVSFYIMLIILFVFVGVVCMLMVELMRKYSRSGNADRHFWAISDFFFANKDEKLEKKIRRELEAEQLREKIRKEMQKDKKDA